MLDVDRPAILRAVGLLRAFAAGDTAQWGAVLATDYDGEATAYQSFCAMTALMDRALDWLGHETGHDRDTLLRIFTAGFGDLLDSLDADRATGDDDPPDAA